uniref:Uncharacterized protein AlNc14C215G8998 n=1 Tax=Albugo laibachii Nc14 TaxID=890382 RepID=F0WRJ8_9STRA|nr:conserved hypothetical protein [Albugo laibachii Nc14]|eukprot:CCA23961.1 conserved hypothetical protein [Albugo laibachii Nc14]
MISSYHTLSPDTEFRPINALHPPMGTSNSPSKSLHPGVEMDPETVTSTLHHRHRRKPSSTSPCPSHHHPKLTTFIQIHLRNRPKCSSASESLCTSDELINYWNDLSMESKQCLLRIHRQIFFKALDQFLIRRHLCFECHENVIAEWEDLERGRVPRKRSLLDVFSVLPPFSDSDEDESLDNEEASDLESSCQHFHQDENQIDAISLHQTCSETPCDSSCEAELLRLFQTEERFIVLDDTHIDLMDDLIRCGGHFAHLMPLLSDNEIPIGSPSRLYDDDYHYGGDNVDCPGASSPRSAQEYILDLLALQFREQLEMAYHEAIRQSLKAQAELLREEKVSIPMKSTRKKKKKRKKSLIPSDVSITPSDGIELDREVEEFRLLLEEIHAEARDGTRRKLVLPPGTFASFSSEPRA